MKSLVVGGAVLFFVLLNILSFSEPDGGKIPGVIFTTIVDFSVMVMLIVIVFEAVISKFTKNNS